MKKKITIVFLVIILLSALSLLGVYYLNTYYLPKIIKARIIQTAQKELGIVVGIKDIKFSIFKGVVLYDVGIASKKDTAPTLQIERVTVNFLLPSFFKQIKIILPSINLYHPKLDIIRYEDNRLNIMDFIPQQADEEKTKPAFSVLIQKIDVYDADITFLDKTTSPNFSQIFKLNSLRANIFPSLINFSLSGVIINEKQSSAIKLNGKFQFKSKELRFSSQINKLSILPYLAYAKELPATINTFLLNNINAEGVLTRDDLSLAAIADIEDAYLIIEPKPAENKTIISNAKAKLKASFNFDLKNKDKFKYSFGLDDINGDLDTQKIKEKIKIEYAKLEIAPDKLEIKNSKIRMLQTTIDIKGTLENFSNPLFNIRLISNNINIATARTYLADYLDFIKTIAAQGKAGIDVNLSKTSKDKELEFQGSLWLQNASIKTENIPYGIDSVNGSINFDNEKIDWANLSFNLQDALFYSKATILNLKSPTIMLELYSDKLNIHAKIIPKQKNVFDIAYLSASYYNSKLDLIGNLDITNENYYLADFNVQSQLNLEDIKMIKKIPQENISQINPQGKCKITGRIQGNIKNAKSLTAFLNLTSSELKFYGVKLSDLDMRLALENQQLKIPQSDCKFYEGILSLNGLLDLNKENFPYALKINLANVDLYKLKFDTTLKDDPLEGILSSTVILSGNANSLKDVKGQGEFLIKDGYLWGFNPLQKLGDFLFIPKYDAIVFKEANGSFDIYDNKISTDDVVLTSDAILLSCEGTIDFAGNLNLDFTPKPAAGVIDGLGEYEKFFAGIFSEAGGVVTVRVTGTVKEPKFEKKIIVMRVIDEVKDRVVDKIKQFTDLIFGSPE